MKKIWLFLGFPLAVGGLATLLAGGMGSYSSFTQPPYMSVKESVVKAIPHSVP